MDSKTKVSPTSTTPSTPSTQVAKTKKDMELSPAEKSALIQKHGTKSGAIRALFASGKSRGDIAAMLGIRYQHVRNVLITPVKNPKVPA